ncbi:MAG: PilZ domain-containing protein [Lachnospiraceae bacterium]|nr:PilZ domain-containing protein [Lachnospiraceae bacterium]
MEFQDFRVDDTIELEIKFKSDTMSINTTVAEIWEDYMLIPPIMKDGKIVGFNDEGCSVNLVVNDPDAKRTLVWKSIDIRPVRLKGTVYHALQFSGSASPYNRRKSFRLYIGEEMQIKVRKDNVIQHIDVLVKDISEGGVGFLCSDEFNISKTLTLRLQDKNFSLDLPAKIVRREASQRGNTFLYGAAFQSPNKLLNKWIAKKQNEDLKKKNGR